MPNPFDRGKWEEQSEQRREEFMNSYQRVMARNLANDTTAEEEDREEGRPKVWRVPPLEPPNPSNENYSRGLYYWDSYLSDVREEETLP